jgi:hypothetical protein
VCDCQLAQPGPADVVQGIVVYGDAADRDCAAGAVSDVLPSFAAAGGIDLVRAADTVDFVAVGGSVLVSDLAVDPMKLAVRAAAQVPLQRCLHGGPAAILQPAGSTLPRRAVRNIAPVLAEVPIPAAVEARDWVDKAEPAGTAETLAVGCIWNRQADNLDVEPVGCT